MDSLVGKGVAILLNEGPIEFTNRAIEHILARVEDPFYKTIFPRLSSALTKEELVTFSKRCGCIYTHEPCPKNINNISLAKRVEEYFSYHIDTSPPLTCVIPDAKTACDHPLILTNGGQPVLPSIAPWPIHIGNQMKKSHVDCHFIKTPQISINLSFDSTKRENKTIESAINLTTKRGNHYGHWLLDHLPKLYYLSEYEKITSKKPRIIVNPNAPKWMIDSIRCMGFSRDRIISQNNKTFSVTNMIVPIHNRQLSPVPFRWLRSRAVEHGSSSESSKRVFLSRQGVTDETQSYGNRKIQNFEEVKNILIDLSFEIIRPEELSFKKQVDVISNADIIMGVYGSALHNLIFSSDTKIIEILHQDHPFYVNYVLSLISDNEYIGIKTTPGIENADYELNHIRNQPLFVSPSQIKKQIQRL